MLTVVTHMKYFDHLKVMHQYYRSIEWWRFCEIGGGFVALTGGLEKSSIQKKHLTEHSSRGLTN